MEFKKFSAGLKAYGTESSEGEKGHLYEAENVSFRDLEFDKDWVEPGP